MNDSELMAGYDDPVVMAAVSDIAAHPEHAPKHMANPKVMHPAAQVMQLLWHDCSIT